MSVVTTAPGHDLALCIPDLRARKKDPALAEMATAAGIAGFVTDASLLAEFLKLRERLGVTAIGKGVAIPHARSTTVHLPRLVIARSPRGIDWSARDEMPVQLVILVLSPAEWTEQAHHGWLARGASLARLQRTRQKLVAAPTPALATAILREALS